MNRILFFLIFLVAFVEARPINEGNKLFAAADYEGALAQYMKARESEPASPLLFYNIGTCYYQLGKWEEAKAELETALRMPDPSLASKAAYNLANTMFRIGETQTESAERVASWRESIAYFKKAIDLNSDFEKAKRNVEIVQRKLKEELDKQKENKKEDQNQDQKQPELSERAKELLARALQLCKEEQYTQAKSLLEQLLAEDETAAQLAPYIQRIDDIIEIRAGRKPKAKIDTENVDNDLEVI